eukprot:TRINITY_DN7500_c0_g1_i1.p1 TRINITY_DN7500_c0_g1~~TRINITY_DN7500_c0_g1_i1.p1  ORF type:complete len:122 (+),score=20.06 TRINITY_DN7500_c0_g1_i1:111-476(+)
MAQYGGRVASWYFSLLLGLCVLVNQRLDGDTDWSWAIIFVPLWVLQLMLFAPIALYMSTQGDLISPTGFLFLLTVILLFVFEILLLLKIHLSLSYSYMQMFSPLLALFALYSLIAALIPSR